MSASKGKPYFNSN